VGNRANAIPVRGDGLKDCTAEAEDAEKSRDISDLKNLQQISLCSNLSAIKSQRRISQQLSYDL